MVTGVLRRPCSKPVGWCMRLDELECIQTSEQTLRDSSGSFIFGPLHPKPRDYGGWWGTFLWQGDEKINVFNLLSWSWQLFTVENKVNKVRDSSELFLILIVIVILSCGPQRDQAVVPDGTSRPRRVLPPDASSCVLLFLLFFVCFDAVRPLAEGLFVFLRVLCFSSILLLLVFTGASLRSLFFSFVPVFGVFPWWITLAYFFWSLKWFLWLKVFRKYGLWKYRRRRKPFTFLVVIKQYS